MTGGNKDLEKTVDRLDDTISEHSQQLAELRAKRDADRERAAELAEQLRSAVGSLRRSSEKYEREANLNKGLRMGGYGVIAFLLLAFGIILKYDPQFAERVLSWLIDKLSTKN